MAPPALRLPQQTSPALQFEGLVHESAAPVVQPPIGAQLSLGPPPPRPTQHSCVVASHVIVPQVSVVDAGPEPLLALLLLPGPVPVGLPDPLLPGSLPVDPPVDPPLYELDPEVPSDPVADPVGLVVPRVS